MSFAPLTFAELPDGWNGITVAVIGTVVVLALVAGAVLYGLQQLREALTKEIRMQSAVADEAQKVEVQSPLTVQAHIDFTPLDAHRELVAEFRDFTESVELRFREQATASSGSREKVYTLIREQGAALQKEVKDDVGKVHDRVNIVLAAVSKLDGKIESLTK